MCLGACLCLCDQCQAHECPGTGFLPCGMTASDPVRWSPTYPQKWPHVFIRWLSSSSPCSNSWSLMIVLTPGGLWEGPSSGLLSVCWWAFIWSFCVVDNTLLWLLAGIYMKPRIARLARPNQGTLDYLWYSFRMNRCKARFPGIFMEVSMWTGNNGECVSVLSICSSVCGSQVRAVPTYSLVFRPWKDPSLDTAIFLSYHSSRHSLLSTLEPAASPVSWPLNCFT